MFTYLFLCPFFISALIYNKVLRTHLLTLVNKNNKTTTTTTTTTTTGATTTSLILFSLGLWNGFISEFNIYRTITLYVSCNMMKYFLVLCRVIIISQIA